MVTAIDSSYAAIQRSMIANVLSQYAWAYDLDRLDFLDACFARDAQVEFGDTGLKIGRAAVVAELRRRRDKYRPSGHIPWHVVTNVFVQLETPASAQVWSWYSFGEMVRGKPMALHKFGRYDDNFILEDEAWRIARRRVLDLNSPNALDSVPQ
jgi:SnoaL-like domain